MLQVEQILLNKRAKQGQVPSSIRSYANIGGIGPDGAIMPGSLIDLWQRCAQFEDLVGKKIDKVRRRWWSGRRGLFSDIDRIGSLRSQSLVLNVGCLSLVGQ